ncbi:hypothetical protein [Streptomyces microflavus]|uniref:hypothetical protein n=1 Tax=Streptomyces microflavus TaxID=1919 RepID=UPI00381393F3
MPSTTFTAPDDAVLSACKDIGVAAFFDPEDRVIYAHPATVPRAKALDGLHIVIAIEEATVLSSEMPPLRVSAWEPDGSPELRDLGTVYASDHGRSIREEADRCARAAAEFFAARTAGLVLLAALAEYGILPGEGLSVTYAPHSTYDVFLPLPNGAHARLAVADRDGSVTHVPAAHTGWSVVLHDERGEVVGEQAVWVSGDGSPLDCAEDSAATAAFIADVVTAPISRHGDCYNNEHPGRTHDRACNRYAPSNTARGAA